MLLTKTIKYNSFFVLAFAVLANLSFSQAYGADEPAPPSKKSSSRFCSLLLGETEPSLEAFSSPRPGFVHDTTKYRYGGLKDFPIKNQCAYGSCWAHAGLSFFEHRALLNTGRAVELSVDYIIARKLIDEALKRISEEGGSVKASGSTLNVSTYGKKYGFIPTSVWYPRIAFGESGVVSKRLQFHLNMIIQDAILKKDLGNFDEKQTEESLIDVVQSFTGAWPETFDFEGKTYTPQEFAADPRFALSAPTGEPIFRRELEARFYSPQYLAKRLIEQLDQTREPVALGIGWEEVFYGQNEGILSIAAFSPYSDSPESLVRIVDLARGMEPPASHAVYIVDYELDESGQPVKFLAVNSWGGDSGDKGHLHIYWDYFKVYVKSVDVYKKSFDPQNKRYGIQDDVRWIFEKENQTPKDILSALGQLLRGNPSLDLKAVELLFILDHIEVGVDAGLDLAWGSLRSHMSTLFQKNWEFSPWKDPDGSAWESYDIAVIFDVLQNVKAIQDQTIANELEEKITTILEKSRRWNDYNEPFQRDVKKLFHEMIRERLSRK